MWTCQEMHSLHRLGGPGSLRRQRRSGTYLPAGSTCAWRGAGRQASQGRLRELRRPGPARPAIGLVAGQDSVCGKEWHELKAQPWKLEPMGRGESTLGYWNLAPKDNSDSTETMTKEIVPRALLCAKHHIISNNFPSNPMKKVLSLYC